MSPDTCVWIFSTVLVRFLHLFSPDFISSAFLFVIYSAHFLRLCAFKFNPYARICRLWLRDWLVFLLIMQDNIFSLFCQASTLMHFIWVIYILHIFRGYLRLNLIHINVFVGYDYVICLSCKVIYFIIFLPDFNSYAFFIWIYILHIFAVVSF